MMKQLELLLNKVGFTLTRLAVLIIAWMMALSMVPVCGDEITNSDSQLSPEALKQIGKADSYLKEKRPKKAIPVFEAVLSQANNVHQCLEIAQHSERYGFPLLTVRRECLDKALSYCNNQSEYIQVALKAREYELADLTQQIFEQLTTNATTLAQLYDLATEAQAAALTDLAHDAMVKAYDEVKSVAGARAFAKKAQSLGMDDLMRRAYKDLIDDENDAHELIALLKDFESFGAKDANRYLLKRALDKAQSVPEFVEIFEAAKRDGDPDIARVAAYRGRKLKILQQEQVNDAPQPAEQ